MKILVSLLINALAVYVTASILDGVVVDNFLSALITAVVLGVVNTFIRPLLLLLTLPVTILSLGLFALVINAVLILLVSSLIEGFSVASFWWALLFSLINSLVAGFLAKLAR